MSANILLISFYNSKSLGLRYLENSLNENGFLVKTVFFKDFNSVNPKRASEEEIKILRELINDYNPIMIGLSVMTSLYLETVLAVNKDIKSNFKTPVCWGGVYPTMFPAECVKHADFVIRGEGEEAIVELADAIKNGLRNFSDIKNLVYRSKGDTYINELRPLCEDLSKNGIPVIGSVGSGTKYLIENNMLSAGDPLLKALSYELSASRGCPFACSYCCSANLHRISAKKGKYVRFRSVDNVMEELLNAQSKIKNLKVIHFWDEVFCDDPKWIDDFATRYKKEINLPFEIWGHPLKTNEAVIRKLQEAGLYKVVMGIQSGSPYIRKEIFNRPEKQADIINSSAVLAKCGVPQVIYDFMLRHPFETHETLKETYELVTKLKRPFELQLHGLNFLPGTDIVQKALDMKLVTPDDMERFMYAPIEEQYNMYWKIENNDMISNFWYMLIYLTQFPVLRKKAVKLSTGNIDDAVMRKLGRLYKLGGIYSRLRYLYRKGVIVLKGTFRKG